MTNARFLALLICLCAFAAPGIARAQVVLLPSDLQGDLPEDARRQMQNAIQQGADDAASVQVVPPEVLTERVGDKADCADSACVKTLGENTVGQVAVHTAINAEAEIYDFTVTVFNMNTGEELLKQTGDCMFCPVAEAVEALKFTVNAAVAGVNPLPAATTGPVAAAAGGPGAATPDPVEAVTPLQLHKYLEGDIVVGISVVPNTAEIRVNDEVVGTGTVQLRLAPQELQVDIAAPGHGTHSEKINLRPSMVGPIFMRVALSEDTTVVVQAVNPAASAPPPTAAPAFNQRAIGGVLIGTGVLALGGGAALLAIDGKSTCPDGPVELCEEVYATTAGGAILTALGAASSGVGIGLFATSRRGAPQDGEARLVVVPSRRGASVRFAATF